MTQRRKILKVVRLGMIFKSTQIINIYNFHFHAIWEVCLLADRFSVVKPWFVKLSAFLLSLFVLHGDAVNPK